MNVDKILTETPIQKADRIRRELAEKNPLYQLDRKTRRKEQKRIDRWQKYYGQICTAFITKLFSEGIEVTGAAAVGIFEYYERKWKHFARYEISIRPNSKLVNTPQKREKLLGRFAEFVESYTKKLEDKRKEAPAKAPFRAESEREQVGTPDDMLKPKVNVMKTYPVKYFGVGMELDEFRGYLNQVGSKTKATKAAGLHKAFQKLTAEQLVDLEKLVGGE